MQEALLEHVYIRMHGFFLTSRAALRCLFLLAQLPLHVKLHRRNLAAQRRFHLFLDHVLGLLLLGCMAKAGGHSLGGRLGLVPGRRVVFWRQRLVHLRLPPCADVVRRLAVAAPEHRRSRRSTLHVLEILPRAAHGRPRLMRHVRVRLGLRGNDGPRHPLSVAVVQLPQRGILARRQRAVALE